MARFRARQPSAADLQQCQHPKIGRSPAFDETETDRAALRQRFCVLCDRPGRHPRGDTLSGRTERALFQRMG